MSGGLDQFITASPSSRPLTAADLEREIAELWQLPVAPSVIMVAPRTVESVRFFQQVPRWKGWLYRLPFFRAKMERDLDRWLTDHLPPSAT